MKRYFNSIAIKPSICSSTAESPAVLNHTNDNQNDHSINNNNNGDNIVTITSKSNSDDENMLNNSPIIRKKYNQKPRMDAWRTDPFLKDWIEFKAENIECKFCHTIFKNIKYSNLKDHAKTQKHLKVSEPFSSGRQKNLEFKKLKVSEKAYESEARISLYVAKHSSILSVDHFTKISKLNYTDSNICANVKLCRTKCSGIISNIWYPYFKSNIIKDVGNSPFSLIIDESTDISIVKYLGVVIKYYSKIENICKTSLLKLQPLDACDSNAIVIAILDVLKEYSLKIENMCGLGTDNASVMTGIKNGVFAKLKTLNPRIILIPCVCHSIQLACSAAFANVIPQEVDFIVSETYNWFSRSPNRQKNDLAIFKLINEGHNPLKITQSCATRWLSIESAVTRIHTQYLELKTYFSIAEKEENCYKITSLAKMYNDESNYAYLCFFKPILQDLQKVNKIFESEKADFVKVLSDLELLIKTLIKKVIRLSDHNIMPEWNINLDTTQLQSKPYLGCECEEKLFELHLSDEKEILFRNNCTTFLLKLIKELQQRMPKNLKILQQIRILSVNECLCVNKNSLTPLLEDFNYEFITRDKICAQWENILLTKWNNTTDTVSFWCEVLNYKDASGENPYNDIATFAVSILVLPISNAEVERIFSQLNLIKTKFRNRMQLKLTNSILIIRNQMRFGKCCNDFVIPDEIIKKVGTGAVYNDNLCDDDIDEVIESINIM